ncbi:YHS domain-containing protein [Rubritalea squalenifaciens DSM 18772]|uniref:YHS domain-containing protein n=1 Tax=Rubritalea squalenifaciens DSM 18772 TaxID=1123071 RepID=A0A1M6GIM2_9BACT|nr:YHS domain-containing protein [Rubritalea squalenifaciens]SHJ09815.1 YHS domain-containing protein [Rubritalea squalenifaciens DSM 18772]
MKSIIVVILSALSFLLVACNQSTEAKTEAQTKPSEVSAEYPLDVCVVSGKKLGSMGDPYVVTYEGQEVRFCCSHCEPKFQKDPASYLAKLKKGKE